MFSSIQLIFLIGTYLTVPAVMIWGWIRWFKNKSPRTIPSTLSFVGFCFATASALLGLFTSLYVRTFPYYDPALMRMYTFGGLLSEAAILFAVGGVWRRGPVRWHAPACALGTLLFWIVAASSD
jgi:hypothetical protein